VRVKVRIRVRVRARVRARVRDGVRVRVRVGVSSPPSLTAMRHFIASARFAEASAFVKLLGDLPLLGNRPEDAFCPVRRARTLPCACVRWPAP
jgi:hypothetical protein